MSITNEPPPDSQMVSPRPSLLVSLHEVDDWLRSEAPPGLMLGEVACTIGNRLHCDACSIYRLDRQGKTLILAATVGLRKDCVETLRMNITEGLCGLVIQQRRPISVAANAAMHPRFRYFPEAGEEPYETFLGVPIVDIGHCIGVLVVQTVEIREYTDSEQRLLALAGRQLGSLVSRLRKLDETS